MPLLAQILERIPLEYQDRYRDLASRDDYVPSELLSQLDQYLVVVHQIAPMIKLMDPQEAERLADVSRKLLALDLGDRAAYAHAAIQYFLEEDEDEEITGVLGFADDIQVMNAVTESLGLDGLRIPLSRH